MYGTDKRFFVQPGARPKSGFDLEPPCVPIAGPMTAGDDLNDGFGKRKKGFDSLQTRLIIRFNSYC